MYTRKNPRKKGWLQGTGKRRKLTLRETFSNMGAILLKGIIVGRRTTKNAWALRRQVGI